MPVRVGNSFRGSRSTDATKAALAVLVILSLAALVGTTLLRTFGISLDAFQVAGGGVLVWMGFSMLRGPSAESESPSEPDVAEMPVLTPLILFAASPCTITGVITLAASHSPSGLPATALTAVAVAIGVTWLVLLLTTRMAGRQARGSLVHDVTARCMGLIVLAMGVQFALTGIRSFMTAG